MKRATLITHAFAHSLLIIALSLTGCGDDTAKEQYTLATIHKIGPDMLVGARIRKMLVTADKALAYVLDTRGSLYHVKLTQNGKSILEPSNWQRLTLRVDSKPNTVGKARLDEAEQIGIPQKDIFLNADKTGLLVLTKLEDSPASFRLSALAYFKGAELTPSYAWTNSTTHVEAADFILNADWRSVVAVKIGNTERIVLANDTRSAMSVEVGANKFTGSHKYGTAGGSFASLLQLVHGTASNGTDNIFFVDRLGVSFVTVASLGTNQNTADITPDAASAKWQMLTGKPNNTPTSLLVYDDKLYIGLDNSGFETGGVAVYDIKKKTTTPPTMKFSDIKVSNLQLVDGKIMAVVNDAWWSNILTDGGEWQAVLTADIVKNRAFSSKLTKLGEKMVNQTYYRNAAFFPTSNSEVVVIGPDLCLPTGNVVITYEKHDVPQADKD